MVLPSIPDYATRALQDTVQLLGKTVYYFEAGATTGRALKARVTYSGASELANSIEQYPMRVTLDARDFPTRAPMKGDWLVIDSARRAIEQVTESHMGDVLVKYVCGVRG